MFNIQHKSSLLNNVTNLWARSCSSCLFSCYSIRSFHSSILFTRSLRIWNINIQTFIHVCLYLLLLLLLMFFCSQRKVSTNEFSHLFIWEYCILGFISFFTLSSCYFLLFSHCCQFLSSPPFPLLFLSQSCLLFYRVIQAQQILFPLFTYKLKQTSTTLTAFPQLHNLFSCNKISHFSCYVFRLFFSFNSPPLNTSIHGKWKKWSEGEMCVSPNDGTLSSFTFICSSHKYTPMLIRNVNNFIHSHIRHLTYFTTAKK